MRYRQPDNKRILPIELPCKKTMYNSPEEAQEMINYLKENRRIREIHVYKCEICGFWHLTSKTK
jgi:hypothetical protein